MHTTSDDMQFLIVLCYISITIFVGQIKRRSYIHIIFYLIFINKKYDVSIVSSDMRIMKSDRRIMKIVIIHRDPPPSSIHPCTGSGLRLEQLSMSLQNSGNEVFFCQYEPHRSEECHVSTPAQLVSYVQQINPTILIFVQPEDVYVCHKIQHIYSSLSSPMPYIIVDFYAQRILEASFADELDRDLPYIFEAIHWGDCFLTSNERQRWSWLSILALTGIDLNPPPLITVPLMVPSVSKERIKNVSQELIIVGGGIWWPWQNPTFAIEQVLQVLDEHDCGKIHWYGRPHPGLHSHPLPIHPRLIQKGYCPLQQYREEIRDASFALDWMESNGERELAISFRQMEYIGAGLPILTHPLSPISQMLQDKEAGWSGSNIKDIVQNIIQDPSMLQRKHINILSLQHHFSLYETTKHLLEWCKNPIKSKKRPVRLLDRSRLEMHSKECEQKLIQHEMHIQHLMDDIEKKDNEIENLQQHNQQLHSSVERLSIALERTASFKNESIQILGMQLDSRERNKEEILQQNAILQADNTKKTAELSAMDDIRVRLEHDLQNVRTELNELKNKRRFF